MILSKQYAKYSPWLANFILFDPVFLLESSIYTPTQPFCGLLGIKVEHRVKTYLPIAGREKQSILGILITPGRSMDDFMLFCGEGEDREKKSHISILRHQ